MRMLELYIGGYASFHSAAERGASEHISMPSPAAQARRRVTGTLRGTSLAAALHPANLLPR